MFPVEICIREPDEDALTVKMTAMRQWLDHHRFEPSTFRYTFTAPGLLFRVDFSVQEAAVAFAEEFGGRVMARLADRSL